MPQPTRRAFLQRASLCGFGLGLFGVTSSLSARAPRLAFGDLGLLPRGDARADGVIHIHLGGGMSHIDTFDPKPDAPVEVRGPFGTVKSKLDGEPLGELLRRTAAVADKLVLIRSFTHTEADHDRGTHSVLTGYQPSPALVYPSLGAVVAHQLGVRNDLPPYVCVPGVASKYEGTGFLSAANAPFGLGGNPAADRFAVRDLGAPKGVDQRRRQQRAQLLHELDGGFAALGEADAVAAAEAFCRQAFTLIESESARAAFDLGSEPEAMKQRYGKNGLGMSCLMARRLVAGGARYVTVNAGGFDHHEQIGNGLPPRMLEVDQALAALLADLDAQGLLQRTLVLLTSEFGRTPKLNATAGRDHWPRVFSVVVAGGGSKRGVVHGSSNASGAEPETDPVRPADLAATLYHLLGIDPELRLMAAGNRPVALVRDGRVLQEILA